MPALTPRKRGRGMVYPPHWDVQTETMINGRYVEPGTWLSIEGEPGKFRFVKLVTTPMAQWISVVGGRPGYERERDFTLDRVKTVHRLPPKGKRA